MILEPIVRRTRVSIDTGVHIPAVTSSIIAEFELAARSSAGSPVLRKRRRLIGSMAFPRLHRYSMDERNLNSETIAGAVCTTTSLPR